jgi:hypothetical protein
MDTLVWDLYLAYEQKLELQSTFYPEDDFWKDETLETKEYTDLRCCYVETELASKVCKFDIRMTRVREPLQNLTIQPQITFPPPPLQPGMDPQQIQQFVQDWYNNAALPLLQRAVGDAIDRARKATPTKGFQRLEHRRRWEDEAVAVPIPVQGGMEGPLEVPPRTSEQPAAAESANRKGTPRRRARSRSGR